MFRDLFSHILDDAVFVPFFDAIEYLASLRAIIKATHRGEISHDEVERLVDECIMAERDLSFLFAR